MLCKNIDCIDDCIKSLEESIQTLLQHSELSHSNSSHSAHFSVSQCSVSHCQSLSLSSDKDLIENLTAVMSAADLITQQHFTYSTITAIEPHWKAEEIDFFDSFLNVSYGAEDLISISKDIYYRDVHLFIT